MKKLLPLLLLWLLANNLEAQNMYFPPLTGTTWQTITPAELGWCEDSIPALIDYVGENNSKAFLLLKDGKMVIENYYGTFTRDSLWYWASAGKTLTSMLTGIAQEEGYLSIMDKSSKYLGKGWTSCSPDKEDLITVRNQLTMTSGLDDGVPENHCTLDTCLLYKADAGTRWAYHNAPYTLLDKVIEGATGKSFNTYFNEKIRSKIGMNGFWFKSSYDNVYISNARSFARYGLLVLNEGKWMNTPVIADNTYFNQMVNSSQNINNSYGYLWWLNGKSSFMLPESQFVFPGYLMADSPSDLIAALGKNGQCLNVVPSLNVVVIRMGDSPGSTILDVSNFFNNDIWKRLNDVFCITTTTSSKIKQNELVFYPNPAMEEIQFEIPFIDNYTLTIYNLQGQLVISQSNKNKILLHDIMKGLYIIKLEHAGRNYISKFIKQ